MTATHGPGRGLCLKLSSGQLWQLGGLDRDPSPSHSLQLNNNYYHEDGAHPFQLMCVQVTGLTMAQSIYPFLCEYKMVKPSAAARVHGGWCKKKKKNFMGNVFQVIGSKLRAVLFPPKSEQSIKAFIHQQEWEWKVFVMGNAAAIHC